MSLNSDLVIWLMLGFVLIVILGLYYSEFTPLDLSEKKRILKMNQFIENFSPSESSSTDQAEGASQLYNWGTTNPISFSIPEPHIKFPDFDFCDCDHKPKHHKHKCPKIPCPEPCDNDDKHPRNYPPEICRKCDITQNKDIDKYVLKNSIPPCPDMSKYATKNMINYTPDLNKYILKSEIPSCPKINMHDYIKKSEIPACPTCPICPECPICPVCPTCPPEKQCKEIYDYSINEHPNYDNYISKDELNNKYISKDDVNNKYISKDDVNRNYIEKSKVNCPPEKQCPENEHHRRDNENPFDEEKYKKYIEDLFDKNKKNIDRQFEEERNHRKKNDDVIGYYTGDNLFAGV